MALFKIHKDLIRQEPGLLPFLLSQFDGKEKDVTTAEDAIYQMEAYLLSGEGVPSSGQLDFTVSSSDNPEIPPGATVLKEKYKCERGEFTVWYEYFPR